MAYRFSDTGDYVRFAPAPLSGYAVGPVTLACFFKRSSTGSNDTLIGIIDSGLSAWRAEMLVTNANALQFISGFNTASLSSPLVNDTSKWYLAAVTWAGSGTTPRMHLHDGTSWAHGDAGSSISGSNTVGGTDIFTVGSTLAGLELGADVVCAGAKKSSSSDATIETLTPTAFTSWRGFGFDWLIGFDSSLVSGGLLQDQATPGTGDQTAISGTSVVSDPSGWAWTTVVTPTANFTGTPLTGTEPLSVAFTDSSTNSPTSWAWTFGDGGTSSSQNPTHSYTTAGTFTVALVATNSAGSNTLTRTGYVTVSDQPRPVRINTSQGWVDIGDATSFVSGSGAPTVAAGATGAIYLDTASGRMYGPKTGGAWPGTALGGLTGASGATGARPASVPVGYGYWDTTLGKPVWWNGTVWKDATGATV